MKYSQSPQDSRYTEQNIQNEKPKENNIFTFIKIGCLSFFSLIFLLIVITWKFQIPTNNRQQNQKTSERSITQSKGKCLGIKNVIINHEIDRNTNWNQDICLTGDVVVTENATLTIAPGVRIVFASSQDQQQQGIWEDKVELHIYGTLKAQGTEKKPISFISDNPSPKPDDWGSIIIGKNNTQSILNYCQVSFAQRGVSFYMNHEGEGKISGKLENCEINNNKIGVFVLGAPRYDTNGGKVIVNPIIKNNIISNNIEAGIDLRASTGYGESYNETIITNNTILNNKIGIQMATSSWWLGHTFITGKVKHNTIQNNLEYGIFLKANGSSDGSGSDTNVKPIITNNILSNNSHNIYLLLDPKGDDGEKYLNPIIECNHISKGKSGLTIEDKETSGKLKPTIKLNFFEEFDGENSWAIANLTNRNISVFASSFNQNQVTGKIEFDYLIDYKIFKEKCLMK